LLGTTRPTSFGDSRNRKRGRSRTATLRRASNSPQEVLLHRRLIAKRPPRPRKSWRLRPTPPHGDYWKDSGQLARSDPSALLAGPCGHPSASASSGNP